MSYATTHTSPPIPPHAGDARPRFTGSRTRLLQMIDARVATVLGEAICLDTLIANLDRVNFELRDTGGDGTLGVYAVFTGAKLCDVHDLAAADIIYSLYHGALAGAAA